MTGYEHYSEDEEHLVLDLFGRVGQEDGGVGLAGAHLGLSSLQRREEGGVKQSRLRITDPRSHVPRHPEVRVLRRRVGNQFQCHGKLSETNL